MKSESRLRQFQAEAIRAGVSSPARQQRYIRARYAGAPPDEALKRCKARERSTDEPGLESTDD